MSLSITEVIALAIDKATVFDAEGRLIWLNATVDYAPDGETVSVTVDPDAGETIRLAVRRVA